MRYAYQLRSHANARYQDSLISLSQKELACMLSACGVDAQITPCTLGGAPFLCFEADPLTPAQAAFVHGHSALYMTAALDAGDVIAQVKTPIGPDEDAPALFARLAELGAQALSGAVQALADGTAVRTPQDESAFTYAPMLSRELSPIDWTRSAHAVNCQIRGLIPWPAASTDAITGEPMKVFRSVETGADTDAEPGTVLSADKHGIAVAFGDGKVLCLTEIQAVGGKRMAAADYLRGHPIQL